jgi:hypothetical protein
MNQTIPTINIDVIDDKDPKFGTISRPVKFSVDGEGNLLCFDADAVDYYGEFRGNIPWIHPRLTEWADRQNGYWEWENAEAIVFVPEKDTTFTGK